MRVVKNPDTVMNSKQTRPKSGHLLCVGADSSYTPPPTSIGGGYRTNENTLPLTTIGGEYSSTRSHQQDGGGGPSGLGVQDANLGQEIAKSHFLGKRRHFYRISIDLNGNYTPVVLKDAKSVPWTEVDPRSYVVQWKDTFNLRPLSSRTYRAVSLCSGAGIDSEAARRSNFKVVYAAESREALRALFRDHFGVIPESSNSSLYEKITGDVVLCTFGTECRSLSTAGIRNGLGNTGDWDTFNEAVDYLERDKVLCFHYENVAALAEDSLQSEVFKHVLHRLGKEYVLKWGVVCPSAFGKGAARRRTHIIGMRREEAAVCGFIGDIISGKGVIDKPFSNAVIHPRCIADHIEDRWGEMEEDQIDLRDWMTGRNKDARSNNERWEIVWAVGFKTEEDRLITRVMGYTLNAPVTLGYVKRVADGTNFPTTTGFKIGHVYGLLHGITRNSLPEEVQGPGGNSSFYWDPLTNKIRTLGAKTIRRIWDMEDWPELGIKEMGQSAHPAATQANLMWMALYLDKYYALTASIPPVPRISFNTINDVLTLDSLSRIRGWTNSVVHFVEGCRRSKGKKVKSPSPLIIDDGGIKFWARGWHFDLRGKVPKRVCRNERNDSKIRLLKLCEMIKYNDPDGQWLIDWIGSSTGGNPAQIIVMHSNDCGFVEAEEIAHEQFDTEEERGWLSRHREIPMCPIRVNPHFMLDQGKKTRRIFNVSKDGKMSINASRVWNEKADLELVQHEWMVGMIGELTWKTIFMLNRGYDVELVLWVVDLFSAYTQVSVDLVDQWQTCSSVVNPEAKFDFLVVSRSSFGPENMPMIFTRVTRAVNYSCDRLLDKADDYPLQDLYRRELMKTNGDGVPGLPEDDREPELKYTFERRREKKQRKRAQLKQKWGNGERCEDLVAEDQIMFPGASVSEESERKAYKNATYLDDGFGGFIVFKKKQGRMAFEGGETTSNTAVARKKYEERKGIKLPEETTTSAKEARRRAFKDGGRSNGERLRLRYVRKPMEEAGLIVVGNPKSQKKYDGGACNYRMTILGCIYDVSDVRRPTIELTEEKREQLEGQLTEVLKSKGDVPLKEWESVVGRLNNASKVLKSCKVYICGLYAACRGVEEGEDVKVTPWARRNLEWWLRFLAVNSKPCRLFRSTQTTEKKYCPHSDASTGWGFGGFWIRGSTCFYIQDEWTETEKELIKDQNLMFSDTKGTPRKMGINFLEMATVGMLLDVAEGEFEHDEFNFYCDNEATVKILNSYKTRTLPLATLLENIDINIVKHNLTIDFEWIATDKNVESDALSRGATEEFFDLVTRNFGISIFKHVQVPEESRNLEEMVKKARRNRTWVVADGRCDPEPK